MQFLADGSVTVELVSKFCAGWYGRETQGVNGDQFYDDFWWSFSSRFSGESFFEPAPLAPKFPPFRGPGGPNEHQKCTQFL